MFVPQSLRWFFSSQEHSYFEFFLFCFKNLCEDSVSDLYQLDLE